MARIRFWHDLLKRVGLKLSDKLMIGNSDSAATEYCDISDLKSLINPKNPSDVGAAAASHTHAKSDITNFPPTLPNQYALVFTGGAAGRYDGSAPLDVSIPLPSRVQQPTGMSLDYPATVSVRNAVLQRIEAQLLPAFVMQDCVLFLPAGGDAIELYPDGTFRVMRLGKSKIYVIPTQNSRAYKSVEITVRPAIARRTGSGAFRKTGAGKLRLF